MRVLGTFDWNIVNERNSEVGYLVAENVGDVVMEDGDRIGPPHGQLGEAHKPKGCVEGGEIARLFRERAIVVANEKVEHAAAHSSTKGLSKLVRKGRDA